ncbi:MAG: molybdopterin-dependent oxidoreductase [Candidatus Parcubacteria bacterium]|nr:molybdopterin-dependent oxidoreductase [Candidatus Parcubacteria bacterium]
MKHVDIDSMVRGEAQYIDDIPMPSNMLHSAVFSSPVARGKLIKLNTEEAEKFPGVRTVFSAKDIPGENQIGSVIHDEPLFCSEETKHVGDPIALVVADTAEIARKAIKLITCEISELPPIFDPREAYAKNLISGSPEIYVMGDPESMWKNCDAVIEGRVEIGGQEHFYFETQSAISVPTDNGGLKIFSSTQSTSHIQSIASRVLGIPMNKIEVDVVRIGGGFGGKEAQAARWASMTALAAFKLKVPVKLVLNRDEDMKMSGKRHAYSCDYKMGLSKEGKILAYEVFHYQNSGAYSDLSLPVLHKGITHSTSAYYVPNIKVTGASCLTNTTSATAFRGFGSPQAAIVIETALLKASEKLGIQKHELQKKNLLSEEDDMVYGSKIQNVLSLECFDEAVKKYDFPKILKDTENWNKTHQTEKKGAAIFPLCFGVSFDATTFMDQASATVHIYTDGSISVSTAAIEMGQGVNTKIREIVAKTLSVNSSRVKIESTNTTRIANTSATAASSGADLNGNAAILACNNILGRLKLFASKQIGCKPEEIEIQNETVYAKEEKTDWDWNRLIIMTYMNKIGLSAHAFYATPEIFADPKTKKGKLYAYYVFGAAISEVTIDCLRGTYDVHSVKIIHDVGKSLAEKIDLGQVEGAVVQGIGWLTSEEIVHSKDGKILTGNLGGYKLPDIYSAPEVITEFYTGSENRFGPFNSKAIGEPPLLYSISAYFAILNAIKAYNPEMSGTIDAPLTPEKVFLLLHDKQK